MPSQVPVTVGRWDWWKTAKLLNLAYAIKQGSRAQTDFAALGRGLQLINADAVGLIAS